MARTDKGTIGLELQPDSNIVFKNDGTMEASLVYKLDENDIGDLPFIGDEHPEDPRLECVNVAKTYENNGIVTATCSYFGIEQSITQQVIQYSGGTNTDPIESHPQFSSLTASSNYIYDDNGLFVGFTGDLLGVQSYLTASSTVTVSVWRDKPPVVPTRVAIFDRLPGEAGKMPWPTDIRNWLLIDTPYRKYGSFYQVSEVFLGSGPDGWQTEIYT